MLRILILLSFILFISSQESYSIKLIQTINRHGDRTPGYPIEVDPIVWDCSENTVSLSSQDGSNEYIQYPSQLYRTLYLDDRQLLLGNCASGQLTSIGEQQTRSLGSYLRNLLVNDLQILSSTYNSSQIFVRASDVSRCKQTARNILDELYPLNNSDNSTLVIPVWLVETKNDDMQLNLKFCLKSLEVFVLTLLENPSYIIKLIEPLVPHRAQLKNIFNFSLPFLAAWKNYDNCNCRIAHDLSLPNGMTQPIYNAIQKSYWFGGELLFNITAPYTMGKFANELIQYMEDKILNSLVESYQFFSGHDSTVGLFLSLLGIYNGNWPPYACHLELTLLQASNSGSYFVQVTYNGDIQYLPGCGYNSICEFNEFKNIITSQTSNISCEVTVPSKYSRDLNIFDIIANELKDNIQLPFDL